MACGSLHVRSISQSSALVAAWCKEAEELYLRLCSKADREGCRLKPAGAWHMH